MEPGNEVSAFKSLDLTAKYAQLNTLRKMSQDMDFYPIRDIIIAIMQERVKLLTLDVTKLHITTKDPGILPTS